MAASRRASARRCSKARVYDEDGQLVTGSLHGLRHAARRRPAVASRSARPMTPCPSNPLGIKGCGEAGAIASPPAVINAITDALGHEDIAMPATPQAVWQAAQKTVQAGGRIAAAIKGRGPCRGLHRSLRRSPGRHHHVRLHLSRAQDRPAGRLAAGQVRGRQAPGRRPDAAADHEAAARRARRR